MAIGMGVALGANLVAGIVKRGIENRQQKKQQQKLMDMQMAGQKEMGNFNQELGMKNWNETGFGAQRAQMEGAGLNVGMMYGGTGGGGSTQVAGGNVGQGQASGDIGNSMGIEELIALKRADADIKNTNASTELTEVQKEKLAGVDTEGVKLDNSMKEINNRINKATEWDQVNKAYGDGASSIVDADMKARQNGILGETQWDQIEIIRKEAIRKGIEIKAMEAGIKMTEAETKETMNKINKIATEISNMKNMTEIQKQDMLNRRIQTEFNTSDPAKIKQWVDIGTDVIKAVK